MTNWEIIIKYVVFYIFMYFDEYICIGIISLKILLVISYKLDTYKQNKSNFHHDKFHSWETKTSTQLWKDAWRVVFSAK